MKKKTIFALVSYLLLSVTTTECYAAHSSLSPMSPRQKTVVVTKKDYSYGLTVLPGNSIDGLEYINRNLGWRTNYEILDRYILRPVAHGYDKLPEGAKNSVHNFFSNISDLNNTVNNALLARPKDSGISISRFCINSTIGLLGLFDVATMMGIEQKAMSLNTVAGKAGVDQGEYLMVPVLGPTTERGLVTNTADSWPYMFLNPYAAAAAFAVQAVDTRASLIPQEEMVDKAVDPYAQMRQIYLMHQEGKVNPEASMENKSDENVDEYLEEIDSL